MTRRPRKPILSVGAVQEARSRYYSRERPSMSALAREYGVGRSTMERAIYGRNVYTDVQPRGQGR